VSGIRAKNWTALRPTRTISNPMRLLLLAFLLVATTADAKPKRHDHKKRAAHALPKHGREHHPLQLRGPLTGQSIGAPWDGMLRQPSRLPDGDGYVIRRPNRAFGTHTTVELVHRVITQTLEAFPDVHVLGIGDISAEHGGSITEHHSHQSGRDADIGLFYVEKPETYPAAFVRATEDNLDREATFALISGFYDTRDDNGGAQMIFLDFEVQGLLYEWALDHGVSERRLDRLFQYPNGRGGDGFVRHEPNHDNHMHVRFKCPDDDASCR
jgi:murein endopeptidase